MSGRASAAGVTEGSGFTEKASILRQEAHEFGIDLLRARPGYAVRASFDLHVLDVLDHLYLPPRGCVRRQDAVVVAVYCPLELVKGPEGSWGRGGKQRIRPFCIVADKQVEAAMEGKSNAQLANVTALAPSRTMSTKAVIKLIVRPLPSISRATFLSLSVAAAHAAPLNCGDWNEDTPNQVALARVVTTQTRLHFIAGRDKRRPACPSLGIACKLKAFLLPDAE